MKSPCSAHIVQSSRLFLLDLTRVHHGADWSSPHLGCPGVRLSPKCTTYPFVVGEQEGGALVDRLLGDGVDLERRFERLRLLRLLQDLKNEPRGCG